MTDKPKHWRDAMHERNQEWINDKSRKVAEISTRYATKAYRDNWDRIFGNNNDSKSKDEEVTGGASINTESPQ